MLAHIVVAFLLASLPYTGASRYNLWKSSNPRIFQGQSIEESLLEAAGNKSSFRGKAAFQQYIDHKNPGLGTFSQRYYWSTEYYGGPGSPIILFTPGETDVLQYGPFLSNEQSTGLLAEEIGAAIILFEHRYWGASSPFAELTTENLQYLTLDNAISDLTHFAETVALPFDINRTSSPSLAPWIMMGGSYSGSLAAWTASTQPGIYWAYWASSAPVQAIIDFSQWLVPLQKAMPKNCSTDLILVVHHIDSVLSSGTASEVKSLKAKFGLEDLEYNDDFAAALATPPRLFADVQFFDDAGAFDFCDAIEYGEFINGSSNWPGSTPVPGAEGVGLEKALAGYANFFNTNWLPDLCASTGYEEWQDEQNVQCYNTHNASSPMYTDLTVDNAYDRQYIWLTCNEPFGWYVTGDCGRPSITSRFVTADHLTRLCPLFFPPSGESTVGIPSNANAEKLNVHTKGWDNTSPNLLYVNGDLDGWREASVSSDFRPNGRMQSTTKNPVIIVPGGYHTSDFYAKSAEVNAGAKVAIDEAVAHMVAWVHEFKPKSPT